MKSSQSGRWQYYIDTKIKLSLPKTGKKRQGRVGQKHAQN